MKLRGGHNQVPGMVETVKNVELTLKKNGFKQAHTIGHSLGTCYVSWMVKYSNLTKTCTLLDPIPFKLYEADVAFNFLHRPPTTATEFLISYLVSSEIYIRHYICRHFIWHHNVLFPQDLHPKSLRLP